MSKTALVTGASRGIGKAIAARLAEDGFYVFGTATSEQGAAGISDALGAQGQGLAMQITSLESIESALAGLDDAIKTGDREPLTILVNNAGITRDNLMLRMGDDEWTDVVDTNLNGTFRVTRRVLRGMVKARWGRIVNIGSVVARMGNPGQGNYVATKAALEGFSRSLANEVASRNITVNCIAPGFIETDMTNELTQDQQAAMLNRIPAGRMGSAAEVAGAVSFLVSDDAGYITAQTLQVNGGLYAV